MGFDWEKVDCFRGGRSALAGALLVLVLLIAGGCSGRPEINTPDFGALNIGGLDIGPRPAQDTLVAVEAYMQLYQPGPMPRLFQTTRIYDRNGVLLAELVDEGNRRWIALDQISPHLINATLATEDATFYQNPGIDPIRIVGAAMQMFDAGQIVSGASTITMQLARNLFLGADQRYNQTMDRKILEAGVAQELTRQFSKDEVLEMYLNLLNYGALLYGPEAAAQTYFGKSAAELTLAEATLLAGIPQQPANLDLFNNFEAAKNRQRVVLNLMVRHGYLTEEGADAVYEQPINLNPDPTRPPVRAPHFVQYVIESLDAQLGEGYTRRAGLNIITTLDWPMQQMAQELVRSKVAELQPEFDMNNAALVSLKPRNGEILTMVGSADFYNDDIAGQVNVATSLRQPGSAIKPILFAAALDRNLVSPASIVWDTPVDYPLPGGEFYTPRNYDERFHGPVTVRSALANSYNIPAVKLLDWVGVPQMLESAHALGLRSLEREAGWYGLSLAVGGGETRLLDLTGAYQALANEGRYVPPRAVLSMTDNRGRQLLENPPAPRQVVSEATAFLTTDILSDVQARQPAFGAAEALRLSRPAAVKTGTTDSWRDNLTVGYTRYLVTGVWVGNTDGSPTRLSTGLTGAAPIWHAFMEGVLAEPALLARLNVPEDAREDDETWAFLPPSDVERVDVCPPYIAVEHACRDGGEFFSRAWIDQMAPGDFLGDSVLMCAGGRGGGEQPVLKLPGAPRLPVDPESGQNEAGQAAQTPDELGTYKQEEQEAARAWSREHGVPVTANSCENRDG